VKLIFAIVHDEDSSKVIGVLSREGYSVTKLSSTGGFLRSGNTTLLIGAEDSEVDKLINIISENCERRKQVVDSSMFPSSMNGVYMPYPIEIPMGGATVFVLAVERFEKI
jgi:uncharacterized protein YaaQ